MPVYEYHCSKCNKTFDELKPMGDRHQALCPTCGLSCKVLISKSSFKMYSPFRKDGEGFSSVTYTPEEAKFRKKHNLMKYDKV